MRYRMVVYHINRYGLCNRLRCLAALQALAELHGAELRMLWEPSLTCPARFEDLFVPVCAPISEDVIEALKGHADVKIVAGQAAGNTPEWYGKGEAFSTAWTNHIRQLRPLPTIVEKVDDYLAGTGSRRLVGVHVRRTDAVVDRGRRLKLTFEDGPVIDAMREELRAAPDTYFVFATDNEDSLQQFKAIFGARLLSYPKSFEPFDPRKHPTYGASIPLGHRHTSAEAAVIDLWLLSRTRRILGTKASSFSQYAAWLGDIELQSF